MQEHNHPAALAAATTARDTFRHHGDLARVAAELPKIWGWASSNLSPIEARLIRPNYGLSTFWNPSMAHDVLDKTRPKEYIHPGRNLAAEADAFFRGPLLNYHLAPLFCALGNVDNDSIEPRAMACLNGIYLVISVSSLYLNGQLSLNLRNLLFRHCEAEHQAILIPGEQVLNKRRKRNITSSLETIEAAIQQQCPGYAAARLFDLVHTLAVPAPQRQFTKDPILRGMAYDMADQWLYGNQTIKIRVRLPQAPTAYICFAELTRYAIHPELGRDTSPLGRIGRSALRAMHTGHDGELRLELAALPARIETP